MLIFIIGGAMFIYNQYPKMSEQVQKIQEPYFESWDFAQRLMNSSYYLSSELEPASEGNASDFEVSPFWEYSLNRYPNELDYYVIHLEDDSVLERQGTLLKQLATTSDDESLWSELESRYQFLVQITFDEIGNVKVDQVLGADPLSIERSISGVIYGVDPTITNLTVIYGVPSHLEVGGPIYEGLNDMDGDYYFIIVIPYLVVTTLVVLFITFMIPYAWIRDFGLIKGLLMVPLELRFLFVIATFFASMGAPFLIGLTEQGFLAESVSWYVNTNRVELWVNGLNILCWSAFILVMFIHALYVKEFFIIGPWKMIRRHTIIGQLYGLVRKEPEIEKVVEEKIVYEESPGLALLKSKVLTLLPKFEWLQKQLPMLASQDEINQLILSKELAELQQSLGDLITIAEQQRKPKKVNLTKVVANCLTQVPEHFHQLELKTKIPNQTVWVMSDEKQLTTLIDECLSLVAEDAMSASRCYVEIDKVENQTQMILRYVTSDRAVISEETQQDLTLHSEVLGATFDYLRDGDLIKMIIKLPIC